MDARQLYPAVLLVGAVQGVVLGLVLFFSASPRRYANRLLAILLFFLSYRLAVELLGQFELGGVDSIWYHLLLEYNWVFGCLVYFFVRGYLDLDFRVTRAHLWHFAPVFVEFIFSNFVKTQNFFWDGTRDSLSWAGYWAYVAWMHTPLQVVVFCLLIAGYAFLSIRHIDASESAAPTRASQTRWIRRLLIGYLVYAAAAMAVAIIDFAFFDYAFRPQYIYVVYGGLALLTYAMALLGLAHRSDPALGRTAAPGKTGPRDLSVEETELLRKIRESMGEQSVYRHCNLSLSSFAQFIGVKPYRITEMLNRELNISFTDFVNGYRVDDVKRRFADPEFDHYTLLAIAEDAGFNSKATFNRMVKRVTGRAPSELRAEVIARRSSSSSSSSDPTSGPGDVTGP